MKNEPCPIPRCALEVMLAVQLAATGAFVAFATEGSSALHSLALGHGTLCARLVWGLTLGIAGACQLVGLMTARRMLHRWTALTGGLAALLFALVLWYGPVLPIVVGPILVLAVAEFFVFVTLRGARWTS